MNWRRGLLLAGINLAVAIPMILMMEARDQKDALTAEEIMAKAPNEDAPKPPEPPTPESHTDSPDQAEQTVAFDVCAMWGEYPDPVVVVQGADMPSLLLAGWEDDCPPHWSLAGRLRGKRAWPPTPLWMETQRKIDASLCLFIATQWFLMGGLPLVRTRKWWADPGAFITACAVLAGALAMMPVIDHLSRAPASIAILAWFWWFGLLVWKALQFVWRRRTIVS
jgi:hypothetical protein